jgi:hypothetical protein
MTHSLPPVNCRLVNAWQKRQLRIVRSEDPALKRMPEVKTGDRIAAADMWLNPAT